MLKIPQKNVTSLSNANIAHQRWQHKPTATSILNTAMIEKRQYFIWKKSIKYINLCTLEVYNLQRNALFVYCSFLLSLKLRGERILKTKKNRWTNFRFKKRWRSCLKSKVTQKKNILQHMAAYKFVSWNIPGSQRK